MLKLYNTNPHNDNKLEMAFSWFKFPGGELHFDVFPPPMADGSLHITTDLANSDEIMLVVLLADTFRDWEKTLELFYTPYARQDRRTSHGEPFSLRAFAKLINSCGFKRVTVYDPHSDITAALIDNIYVIKRLELVKENWVNGILKQKNAVILSPDAGAMKTNNEIAKYYKLPHFSATKVRDIKTGEITSTRIYAAESELKGKDVVILDDICDGGRTFIEIAKVLIKDYEPAALRLYTTVGIYSQGISKVDSYFMGVSCFHCLGGPETIDLKRKGL